MIPEFKVILRIYLIEEQEDKILLKMRVMATVKFWTI